MSTTGSNENKRILYLQQVDIETTTTKSYRVDVKINKSDVEMTHDDQLSTWKPKESLEIPDESKLSVTIKSGHKIGGISFGKVAAQAEISSQEATDAFWDSKESISCSTTFDQLPAIVTFKFRPSQTSEATRAAVDNLQKKMESYRSVMSSKAEWYVDIALKYGCALADLNPISHIAFGIVSLTFDVLTEQRKFDDMVSDLASNIGRILPFAQRTLDDALYDAEDLVEDVVRRLYELIVDAATFICGYAKRCPAVRTLKSAILPGDHAKIGEFSGKFAQLKEDFDRAVDVEALKLARKAEIDRLLDILRPVREANYQEDRGCMEGTRTAVLDQIATWAQKPVEQDPSSKNPEVTNIFWLYGMPGIGKTAVATSLCQRLHKDKNLGGSFFCRRDDPVLREPKRVIPTLVSKLAALWTPFRTLVAQALRDDPHLNPESPSGEILLQPLKSLQKHPTRPLVLVIDALDECGDIGTRKKLLNCLLNACKRVDWLKLVVISRPERDIQALLEASGATSRNLAEDDLDRSDIRHFTEELMRSLVESRGLPDAWPGETRLDQIIARSGGLFIYIETISRILETSKDPDAPLDLILSGESREDYSELHQLYSTAIASRVGQESEKFRSIVGALIAVAMHRPLCDDTFAQLVGEKPHVVKAWVDDLGSVLYRDESQNGGIRVRHLTILEFLTGPSCPSELQVDLGQANQDLSVHCLKTMEKELRFNICEMKTSYLPNSDVKGLAEIVQQKVSDALQYSCLYWPHHVCFNSDVTSEETLKLLETFFTGEKPLFWLEVLSVMGKVPVAISTLRQLKESKKYQKRSVQGSVEDLLRFVLAFTIPISTSAPHIYLSALPFMPLGSGLWERVHKSFPNVMDVSQGRMKSWPARAGIWKGHEDSISCVALSPNGRYVVSGSEDKTIRIWDAETGVAVGEPLRGHKGFVSSVTYSIDGHHIVSGSNDATIRIWDAETGAPVGEPWTGHTADVLSVVCSPNGRYIASGSKDCTIRIWDVETGTPVGEPFSGHTESVERIAYSPDGRRIVSGSGDYTIRIWDAEAGVTVGQPLEGHGDWITSVAYSPDGQNIVSGSCDQTVRIWNAETGALLHELKGHLGPVTCVAYSPTGDNVLSGSFDQTIRMWNAQTGVSVGEPLRRHTDTVFSIAYFSDSQTFISGSQDKTIRVWDAKEGFTATDQSSEESLDWVLSVAYSPSGKHIASGSRDCIIRIWDTETGRLIGKPLSGHTDRIAAIAYCPSRSRIVSGSEDSTLRIWDVETGELVGKPLEGHTYPVTSVSYSPNGEYIVSASADATIRLWNAGTGAAVGQPYQGHSSRVNSVVFSPNARYVASGSCDKTIRIWDIETGVTVGEPLKGHTDWVNGIMYAPDGRHIVSCSPDKTIRIWDAETGAAVGDPLKGHDSDVTSVAYAPDGRLIASCSWDGAVRIWDAVTHKEIGVPLKGHIGYVHALSWSPNGRHIASGSEDQTVRIWDVPDGIEHDTNKTAFIPRGLGDKDSKPSLPLNIASGRVIPDNLVDSNGWVKSPGGLLFWVPEDCRNGLTSPATMTIPTTSRYRTVRIDFSKFCYGTLWKDVYRGGP